MRRTAIVAATLLLGLSAGSACASSAPSRPATVLTIFRLQVAGAQVKGTTYWVAYGPLAGRFGLIRLHERTRGLYVATRRLPTDHKSVFSFIAGHGVVHTRAGLAPGNPVVTIRQIGPTSIWPRGVPTVRWHVPAG